MSRGVQAAAAGVFLYVSALCMMTADSGLDAVIVNGSSWSEQKKHDLYTTRGQLNIVGMGCAIAGTYFLSKSIRPKDE